MTAHRTDVDIDPDRALLSLLGLLARRRGRLVGAVALFALKDSPVWLLPVATAAVIDVVVAGGPAGSIGWWGLATAVLLIQNFPTTAGFVRLYAGAVRELGATLRATLTERLQCLSIGFHRRSSASVFCM